MQQGDITKNIKYDLLKIQGVLKQGGAFQNDTSLEKSPNNIMSKGHDIQRCSPSARLCIYVCIDLPL